MAKGSPSRSPAPNEAPARFLDHYLPYWLSQASFWIASEFNLEVTRAGLTFAEWRVLACLQGSSGETVGTLSRLALMKQPTLSKLVKRLAAENLVARTLKGRQTFVAITAKGQNRIAALTDKAIAHQQAVLQPFGEENARKLIVALQDIVQERQKSSPRNRA